MTLRYLATGDSYKSLQYGFRISHNAICSIVPQTCEAIIAEYGEEVLVCPKTPEEWKDVSKVFERKWNFLHTLGALDGKHVAIKCPPNAGSFYYNYKGFHSLVLMALVDANYKFLYIDVGSNGSVSDGGVFLDSPLCLALEQGVAGVPPPEPIQQS